MQYKAFISYAHVDEKWARWLHRALESYRLPRKRLGAKRSETQNIRRIGTVFRDRDELVAGPALSDAITAALKSSENLIVLCSPAAARSRWVNAEISEYRRLGRSDRVFCVVVDGEPGATDGRNCFPDALFDGVSDVDAEPMAVDVRDSGDGKQLAKLKLVAALLGVRLGDLRDREAERRKKKMLLGFSAAAASVLLLVVTAMAVISERREQERSESLAQTMAELGTEVADVVDLETQKKLISAALRTYEDINPKKLTPESATQVALVIRQMGQVNFQQGFTEESLVHFQQSRQLLEDLNDWYPETPEILNQLSLAHYFEGLVRFRTEEYELAREPARAYERVARELTILRPEDIDYRIEHVWALQNLAILEMKIDPGGRAVSAIKLLEEAATTAEPIAKSGGQEIVGHYATLLSWLAEARTFNCEYEPALAAHKAAIENAELAAARNPGNNSLKRQVAFRHFGLSGLELQVGQLERSRASLQEADTILRELWLADTSNSILMVNLGRHRFRLATIDLWEGRPEAAVQEYTTFVDQIDAADTSGKDAEQDIGLLPAEIFLRLAQAYGDLDQVSMAERWLQRGFTELEKSKVAGSLTAEEVRLFILLRWEWHNYFDNASFSDFAPLLSMQAVYPDPDSGDCRDMEATSRLAAIQGRMEVANETANLLIARGHHHPDFVRFCELEGLCGS